MPLTDEQEKVWDRLKYQPAPGDPAVGSLNYDIESGNTYVWMGTEWVLMAYPNSATITWQDSPKNKKKSGTD